MPPTNQYTERTFHSRETVKSSLADPGLVRRTGTSLSTLFGDGATASPTGCRIC